jgi:hypothetical protein
MTPLVFKYYDHAVIFKVLNNLPKTVKVKYIDHNHTAIFNRNKLYKMNIKDLECKDWILKK